MPNVARAFTYKPKIPAVFRGECLQTIRRIDGPEDDQIHEPGDEITFHTWEGKPYRSKWGLKMKVEVKEVQLIQVFHDEILERKVINTVPQFFRHRWTDPWTDDLARKDFIDPPTGFGLQQVLDSMPECLEGWYQVITWHPPKSAPLK